MIVKHEQKGIEIYLTWSEAEDFKNDLSSAKVYFSTNDTTNEIHYELEEIFTLERKE